MKSFLKYPVLYLEIKQDEVCMVESYLPLILLISIFFIPVEVVLLMGLLLYSCFLTIEIYLKRVTPLCIILFFIFFLLSILYYIFNQRWLIFYTGSFFYFPLAVIGGISLLIKRPFTTFYSGGKGILSLHYTISGIWTTIYTTAGICSITLIPNPAFVYLPFFFLIVGFVLTTILNLFYFGSSYKRKKIFQIRRYYFKETVTADKNSIEDFYSLASQEIWSSIIQPKQRFISSMKELKNIMKNADKNYEDQITRFIAYIDNKPIGTIYYVRDGTAGLPIERDIKKNMNFFRSLGKIAEIGHFTITSSFRFDIEVFINLFKCVTELALEQDVVFILNSCYEQYVGIYQKIGFTKIYNEPIQDSVIGTNVYALVLNFARMVIHYNKTADMFKQRLISSLNQFLVERYYKRQIITNIFKKNQNKQYNFIETGNHFLLSSQ